MTAPLFFFRFRYEIASFCFCVEAKKIVVRSIFIYLLNIVLGISQGSHCIESVRIRRYSGPYFPTFGPELLQIWTFFTQCLF